jgi:hypothetical protein
MVMSERNLSVEREISAFFDRHMPRQARWAYWQKGSGPMFVYNTERIHSPYSGAAEGKFESLVAVPVGKGSRSGKAERWQVLDDSRSLHDLRKDAKARAYRLYQHWLETGEVDA